MADAEDAARLRKITIAFMVVCAVFLGVWDLYVALNESLGDTISEVTRDASHTVWTIPFVFGVVTGHLFWNRKTPGTKNLKGLWVATGMVALRDMAGVPVIYYGNLILLAVGFMLGALWWPQTFVTQDTPPGPPAS